MGTIWCIFQIKANSPSAHVLWVAVPVWQLNYRSALHTHYLVTTQEHPTVLKHCSQKKHIIFPYCGGGCWTASFFLHSFYFHLPQAWEEQNSKTENLKSLHLNFSVFLSFSSSVRWNVLMAEPGITQKIQEENSGFLSEFGCLFKENDYKFVKRMIVSFFFPLMH